MTTRHLFAVALCVALLGSGADSGGGQRPPERPFTLAHVWTLDAVYTDREHGVTFRYPPTWKAETAWGYHPPALTVSGTEPIAGFEYSDWGSPGGPYSGTNLEGVGIVYSAVPASNSAQCEEKAVSISGETNHSSTSFGGQTFTVYETGSAGMNQYNQGNLYVAYAVSTCYIFETGTAGSVLDEDSGGGKKLTQRQLRFIDQRLRAIMGSVRLLPGSSHQH